MSSDWVEERADVLKQMALMQQQMSTMAADITSLRTTLTQVLGELKVRSDTTGGQVSTMQLECVRRGERAEQTATRVSEHDLRLDAVENAVASIKPWIKTASFIGAAVGAALIGLIWAVLTGSAQIVFH